MIALLKLDDGTPALVLAVFRFPTRDAAEYWLRVSTLGAEVREVPAGSNVPAYREQVNRFLLILRRKHDGTITPAPIEKEAS